MSFLQAIFNSLIIVVILGFLAMWIILPLGAMLQGSSGGEATGGCGCLLFIVLGVAVWIWLM